MLLCYCPFFSFTVFYLNKLGRGFLILGIRLNQKIVITFDKLK